MSVNSSQVQPGLGRSTPASANTFLLQITAMASRRAGSARTLPLTVTASRAGAWKLRHGIGPWRTFSVRSTTCGLRATFARSEPKM